MAKIEVTQGDITELEVDAVVNAANETLLGGCGVDGAIHEAAGPALREACRALGGCAPGEAKLTGGFNLPARAVIHTVGPRWNHGQAREAEVLASCYRRSLELARDHDLRRIAFPCISTGVFGFPLEPAARIAIETVRAFQEEHPDGPEVVFCCFTPEDRAVYDALLATP